MKTSGNNKTRLLSAFISKLYYYFIVHTHTHFIFYSIAWIIILTHKLEK